MLCLSIIRSSTILQEILLKDQSWWNYYHRHLETIRPAIVDNIIKVLSCGKLFKGYREYQCSKEGCLHFKNVPQSCNSRFCPTCGKRATDQWVNKQREILPKCEWQHITFTIPKQYWLYFHKHRSLLNLYAKQATDLIQKLAQRRGVKVGIFIAIHTFGRDLQWHPHVHVSVTMGGICLETNQWKDIRFSKKAMMPMWKYRITKLLRDAMKSGLINTDFSLLNKMYHRYWHIHCGKPTHNPWRTITYLGRYIKRPPIALSKLKHYDGKNITFQYLNHRNGKYKTANMDIDHFIYKFTQHVPDKNFRLIRYYGFLANRVRGVLLKKVYELLDQVVEEVKFLGWRALHIHNFGEDPFKCLLCGSEMVLHKVHDGMSHKEVSQHHKALATRDIIR